MILFHIRRARWSLLLLFVSLLYWSWQRDLPFVQHGSNVSAAVDVQSLRLPLGFEENAGQFERNVKFVSRGAHYSLFLNSNDAVLVWSKPRTRQKESGLLLSGIGKQRALSVVRMQLANAKEPSAILGIDPLPGKSNYIVGSDTAKWRTGIANFRAVKYEEIYSGIDLIFHGENGRLEYDFVVAPYSDYTKIRLRFAGAEKLSLDKLGNLLLHTAAGDLFLRKPALYQEQANGRIAIRGGYVLFGNRELGFEVGPYERSRSLVIDPVLSFSSYLGGKKYDVGLSVSVDPLGYIYVAGGTESDNFPTSNTFQSNQEDVDGFVAKIDPFHSTFVYSTYLGGSQFDTATSVVADEYGNAYVTGGTESSDFPVLRAFQRRLRGPSDAYVTKLDPSGVPVYSTYLGGRFNDGAQSITVDSKGQAHILGGTDSADFPTLRPVQKTLADGVEGDMFITKFSTDGSSLLFSTYFGGNNLDAVEGIAVDRFGKIYLVGWTYSTDFPTKNAFQKQKRSDLDADAVVAKLNPNTSSIVYSTYLGGRGVNYGRSVAVDSEGNASVAGTTTSSDFPIRNALKPVRGIIGSAFLVKFKPRGRLLYSTYLWPGTGWGVAVDLSGNTYATGRIQGPPWDFPLVNPFQRKANLGKTLNHDAFMCELNPAGSSVLFSSFLGGSRSENSYAIAVDASGNIYLTGDTDSTDFPTRRPVQSKHAGGRFPPDDAFIVKIKP